MWSESQKRRLDFESEILAKELPQFSFHKMKRGTYISGWQGTTSGSKKYKLKLVLDKNYPHTIPHLYVISPSKLRKYNRKDTVNAEGLSHRFHTWDNGPWSCVQICHTKPILWSPAHTCVSVLLKGAIWLEAYSAHLRTGRDLCDFVS